MKKITSIFLVFAILSLSLISFSASSQITVFVDGDKLDFKDAGPFIEGGRTLVPFRAIAEALGAEVGWDAGTKTVTIIKGNSKDTTAVTDDVYSSNSLDASKNIKIIIGNKDAEVNGNKVKLDVPAKIATGRTYVPLRFVSEAMEMGVNWDAKTKKITIDTPEIYLTLDKNTAEVGDIVKATVNIKNFYGFAGFQVNLKYDTEVLQPIDTASNAAYTESSLADEGTLLKGKYSPTGMAKNDLKDGILSYGSAYINMEAYKNSGKSESTGSVAVFNFKVLKKQQTTVNFQNSTAMVNAKNGTMLFNWDGMTLTNYKINGTVDLNK